MLINYNSENQGSHVKFISYESSAYALCLGTLTLEVDGQTYTFGQKGEHRSFWNSGGRIDSKYKVHHGEWEINYKYLPEELRKYATEIDILFNNNVEHGCCGGCI